jgi:hypothetical protein
MSGPTEAGFLTFIRDIMQIDNTILPDDNWAISFSYNYSINICLPLIGSIPQIPENFLYSTAVYNLAADTLLTYAIDQPGQDYFARYQQQYKLKALVPGVVERAQDESTSTDLFVPDFFKDMTLQNLQNLKTIYGRTYMQIAQSFGNLSLLNIA